MVLLARGRSVGESLALHGGARLARFCDFCHFHDLYDLCDLGDGLEIFGAALGDLEPSDFGADSVFTAHARALHVLINRVQ